MPISNQIGINNRSSGSRSSGSRSSGSGTAQGGQQPIIQVIAYGPDDMTEGIVENLQLVAQFPLAWPVTWVSVNGLGDPKTLAYLADLFGLHPLAVDDVMSGNQRTKVDQYPDHFFVVAQLAHFRELLSIRQMSLFFGTHFVLTFQESPSAAFDVTRDRIRRNSGPLRGHGADYLAYTLLDNIIDTYFPVLERYAEEIEILEGRAIYSAPDETVTRIQRLRRDLLALRRANWPLREVVQFLTRDSTRMVSADTKIYLRDCFDHTTQITELVDTYRDLASGVVDLCLSSANTRMNEIMKVLAMISTIFIPLSFITGIYGMNFNPEKQLNMPELNWAWGYPTVLLLMLAIAISLLIFFWRNGWIGRPRSKDSIARGLTPLSSPLSSPLSHPLSTAHTPPSRGGSSPLHKLSASQYQGL